MMEPMTVENTNDPRLHSYDDGPHRPRRTMPVTRPLLTGTFWLDTFERTIRTVAQVLLGTMGASQLALNELDWEVIGWSVLGAAVISVLMAIVASGIGEPGTASVLNPAPPDTLKDPPAA